MIGRWQIPFKMKLACFLFPLLLTVAIAYYIYVPVPSAIQESWKLMLLDAGIRASMQLGALVQWLGLGYGMSIVQICMGSEVPPGSAAGCGGVAGVRASDTTFDGIPVRVFEPPAGGEGQLQRAVVFLHGGGWAFGGAKQMSYDAIARIIADELNAVVVSVEYRLYPEVHFPTQYDDCLSAAKYFLSPAVLSQYSVDPLRVAVSGDSAGGNLAAALAQEISTDDSVSVKFSVQALVYPVLQALDFNTPSYQMNHEMPVLYRTLMVKFWLQYLGAEVSLLPLMLANNHSSLPQAALTPELMARVDWTTLLPPQHKQHYQPVVAAAGSSGMVKEIPALVDVRASPLLAEPEVLRRCPRTYILTAEFDVLRDDGLMYAKRLQDAGVTVTNDHYADGFHGCFSFGVGPIYFDIAKRAMAGYLRWLQENL